MRLPYEAVQRIDRPNTEAEKCYALCMKDLIIRYLMTDSFSCTMYRKYSHNLQILRICLKSIFISFNLTSWYHRSTVCQSLGNTRRRNFS